MVSGISIFAISFINRWGDEVVSSHETMTEIIAHQLLQYSESVFYDPGIETLFKDEKLSEADLNELDSLLKTLSNIVLNEIKGLEGGFYLRSNDKFIGYAYPTLPPPKPAYGPPPRSYDIIKGQILETINGNHGISRLHEFDPAVFPLSTVPIVLNTKVIGATWVRIHIERKLPAYRLREFLFFVAAISIGGFIVAVIIFLSLQKRTRDIRIGLESIQKDPTYRFHMKGGTYGFITESINSLVDNLDVEHRNLQKLEKEMHQQDKLASLGKLIAGVAHEVKTPLAMIKTRVQLWQHKLNARTDTEDILEIVTPESMELVVKEINRLTDLVNRLLVFSKPINKELSNYNINQVSQESIDLLKMSHPGIEFIETYAANIPDIPIDSLAMKQVIINILSNSIQANAEKGQVTLTTLMSDDKKSILVRIHDNGPGIPANLLNKIFDPFFTTRAEGAGLGLSISYEIIKAHGGNIEFFNGIDGGLTCEIRLPAS